jgi:GNAT superfamily N-acetyltransferase
MDEIRIREAAPADDSAVGELLVQAFVDTYARKMPEVVVTDERKAELRDVSKKREEALVLVAEWAGEVVGTVAVFKPGSPKSEAWISNSADLRHLAIDVRYHGQGIAKLILDEAERIAFSWGIDQICLHVRRGAHGVAKLYTSRGFVRDPRGDLEYPSVFLEAYVLKRRGHNQYV